MERWGRGHYGTKKRREGLEKPRRKGGVVKKPRRKGGHCVTREKRGRGGETKERIEREDM